MSSDYDEDMMVSNILDNFDDIDPEEQSMFMNLNIRNRRQKILHKMSFESDTFDVYNPVYTSEESNSSNTDSSHTSTSQEEEVSGGSSVRSGTSNSVSSKGTTSGSQNSGNYISSNTSESSLSVNEQNNYGHDQDKMDEKDLDYNSENNNSSLSSIHREIQEAPADESSNAVRFRGKARMPGQQIIRNLENIESGGCQVEDMQNDTIMK